MTDEAERKAVAASYPSGLNSIEAREAHRLGWEAALRFERARQAELLNKRTVEEARPAEPEQKGGEVESAREFADRILQFGYYRTDRFEALIRERDAAIRAAAIRDYKCYYCSIRRRFGEEP